MKYSSTCGILEKSIKTGDTCPREQMTSVAGIWVTCGPTHPTGIRHLYAPQSSKQCIVVRLYPQGTRVVLNYINEHHSRQWFNECWQLCLKENAKTTDSYHNSRSILYRPSPQVIRKYSSVNNWLPHDSDMCVIQERWPFLVCSATVLSHYRCIVIIKFGIDRCLQCTQHQLIASLKLIDTIYES